MKVAPPIALMQAAMLIEIWIHLSDFETSDGAME